MKISSVLSNRYRAGGAYLALTLVVCLVLLAVIYFVFYPWGLFQTLGGLELFFITAAIVLVVGPLLLTIIYVPGKKGLAFDLAVIPLLQVAALAYGLHVLYLSRPAYVVFVKDRFEMLRANEVPVEEMAKATRFRELPPYGPRLAGSRLPTNKDDYFRLMFAWTTGIDLQHMPQYYIDYEEAKPEVRAKAQPVAALRPLNPGREAQIEGVVRAIGRPENELGWIPLKGDKRELTAFVDARTGDFIRVAPLAPWK
jgi:hypothetical protein